MVDDQPEVRLSDELQAWIEHDEKPTLGGLVDVFGHRAFAIVFVMLLGVPALPLPTGGATHLFEIIAVLLAAQLVFGRDEIWLPERWRRVTLASEGRFVPALIGVIRRLERVSRPRARFVFGHRATNVVFGLFVAAGSTVAFVAPPFTGLDTLPALGVVLVALGVLLQDLLVVLARRRRGGRRRRAGPRRRGRRDPRDRQPDLSRGQMLVSPAGPAACCARRSARRLMPSSMPRSMTK
jgi:hypothetical protein